MKLREFFKYKHGDAKLDLERTTALMSEMSPRLRAELVILRNNWMRDVKFFHDFPESLVLALSLKMKQQTYPPKELILEKGDYMDNFLMIRKGVLVANGRIITAGQVFGQDYVLEPGRSPQFLQTITFSDVYSLYLPRLGRGSEALSRRTSYAEEETNASIIKKRNGGVF